MLLREVYQRTPDFEERIAGERFRTYEWQFLASLDGVAPVADILRRLNIDPAAISEFILEQERNGSIAPRLVSFEEFLSSTETPAASAAAAPEAKPASAPSPYRGPVRRSPGEELRAIARLSIAAAMGEVLSLISKRRGTTGTGSAPLSPRASAAPTVPPPFAKPAPAASAPAASVTPAADVAPSGVTAFGLSASDANSSVAPAGETVAPTVDESPAPFVEFPRYGSPPAGSRTRDEIAGFQVFDWTLPVAPPSPPEPPPADVRDENDGLYAEYPFNASTSAEIEDALRSDPPDVDVEYLETHAEESAAFDETPGIAERLLRDFGPVSGHDAPLSEPVGESFGVTYSGPPPATQYESSAPASDDWFAATHSDAASPAAYDRQIADESSTLPSYRDPSVSGHDSATAPYVREADPPYGREADPPYGREAEPPYGREAEPAAYGDVHNTEPSSAPRYEEPTGKASYDDALSASRYGEPPPVPYYEPPTSPSFELAATYEPYYEPPAPPSSIAFTEATSAESAAPHADQPHVTYGEPSSTQAAATPTYEAAPPSPYEAAPSPYEAAAPSPYEAAAPSPYEAATQSTYDAAPAPTYEAAPPASYVEQYGDPQRVAFSVNDMDGRTERIEAPAVPQADPVSATTPAEAEGLEPKIDATLTDPIVFSLSARNPDSFWSGKK